MKPLKEGPELQIPGKISTAKPAKVHLHWERVSHTTETKMVRWLRSRPLNKMFHPLRGIRRSKRPSGDCASKRASADYAAKIFQCTKMTKMHREEHLHCCQCAPQELDENHARSMKISLASFNPKTKHLVFTHQPWSMSTRVGVCENMNHCCHGSTSFPPLSFRTHRERC